MTAHQHRSKPRNLTRGATLLAGLTVAAAHHTADAQALSPTVFVAHYFSPDPGGTIATFTVAPDGTPTLVGNYPSGTWSSAMAVSPSGTYLAAATAAGSSDGDSQRDLLFIHRVNADSSLAEVLSIWVPKSASDVLWLSNEVLVVAQTDTSSVSRIWTYAFDPDDPSLLPLDFELSGGFTYTYAIDRERAAVWVEDSFFPYRLARFLIGEDGVITPDGEIEVARFPLGLTLNPAGDIIYAAGGISDGRNKLTAFRVNPIGSPTPASELPESPFITDGNSPARLALVNDGNVLVVGHGTDSLVQTFFVEPDGTLADTGFRFDAGGQGELGGEFVSLGDLVFFTDDSSISSPNIGLYTFRVAESGELTQVGDLLDTGNRRPGEVGMAVWPGSDIPPPCDADFDRNGSVDIFDLIEFLVAFNLADPAANINGDPTIDIFDLIEFLVAFGSC